MISMLICVLFMGWFVFRKQKSKSDKQQQQVHLSKDQKDYLEVGNNFKKMVFIALSLSLSSSQRIILALLKMFFFFCVFISRSK
jgi:preprotein translocase subunit YajC